MAVKIRLARGGAKKKPFYKIVVANSLSPRYSFIEKVGTYNPMLPNGHVERLVFKKEKIEEWLSKGAMPTERVAKFLVEANFDLPKFVLKQVKARKIGQKAKLPKKAEIA
jgi:small subunit ribosomal protein S16